LVKKLGNKGFTLIEMSIVLVIIGLIVGGVLVGRDLIIAASARSQITQIEKYNQAVNVFRGKYNMLPGDIDATTAAAFGFAARGTLQGQGDGNGVIEGYWSGNNDNGVYEYSGETLMFWVDLSKVGLISGNFNTASASVDPGANITGTFIANYLPTANIGRGNYVYVWSGGINGGNGINYFGISAITQLGRGLPDSGATISVRQAYNIDNKIDDGLPQSGNVVAQYLNHLVNTTFPAWVGASDNSATPGSSTTCYDNNNTSLGVQQYSLNYNNATGSNCALSFKFQ